MKVFLNGRFVEASEAKVGVLDAGLQHGVSLFETMQAFNGRVFRLREHIDRLVGSVLELGLSSEIKAKGLMEAVEATIRQNELQEARIRLTVTGGDLSLLGAARAGGEPPKHRPTILITATEPTEYPALLFDKGAMVMLADGRLNPFDSLAGHKTGNYWGRLQALVQAAGAGAAEALWFSVTNHLCSGSVSNVILISGQTLITPLARGEEAEGGLASPVLPGTTRALLLELAAAMGMKIEKRMVSFDDLLGADEAMLTNSSWQALPVVAVEKSQIGEGVPGPVTLQLREKLLDRIAEDCPPPTS